MRHIMTNTDHHYISTVWLETLGYWETMLFRRKDNVRVDWSGIDTMRTDKLGTAMFNHFSAIQHALLAEEVRPKRKRRHK